jgi:hypothetical protein
MHARCAIRPARLLMDLTDLFTQLLVPPRACRRKTLEPRIESAAGDFQHTADRGDPVLGLILSHEREDVGSTASVSRANQAAVFARISRSRRNSCSRAAAAASPPSPRCAGRRSACQRPNQLASASYESSARRRRTPLPTRQACGRPEPPPPFCWRNSGALIRHFAIVDSFLCPRE